MVRPNQGREKKKGTVMGERLREKSGPSKREGRDSKKWKRSPRKKARGREETTKGKGKEL